MISWTLDGQPLELEANWSCSDVANGGYDSFRGVTLSKGLQASQGSIITGYRTDGSVLYCGRLSEEPTSIQGRARLAATGHSLAAERYAKPLLYRHDGFSGWTGADADPHNYNSNDIFSLDINDGRVRIRVDPDESISNGNQAGIVFWPEGCEITKLSLRSQVGAVLGSMSNYSVRAESATGPDGSLTNEGADVLGTGSATHTFSNWVEGADLARVGIERTGGAGTTVRKMVTLDRMKVWGRTTDDTYASSSVASDVASLIGFDDSLVSGSADDCLPLYWEDGSMSDLLDYLTEMLDYRWLVRWPERNKHNPVPILEFGPWSKTYTASLERGVSNYDFTKLERFNEVRVSFTRVTGASGSRSVHSDPDPLPYTNVLEFELQDDQPNGDLADAVAARLLAYHEAQNFRGRLDLGECQDENGTWRSGYDIQAGDLLHIVDFDRGLGPQRVMSVNYSQRGVSVELSQDLSIERLLAKAEASVKKRRKRRRR